MRNDIRELVKIMKKEETKINYAAVARRYGVDYRTVKRYVEMDEESLNSKYARPSILDPFIQTIEDKFEKGCQAKAIYYFIKKKGFNGSYSLVKRACRNIKRDKQSKATIRFETNPGLQAQVDWKEQLTLENRRGETITINIFLMLLGYSRKKYIELTLDRNQDTLFKAMVNGFKYFKGVPKEIIFDNMKTVVDQSKTMYQKAVINDKFYQYSKDMGFEVWACRPYRPQTKGKVEALARTVDRLRVFEHEFDTIEDLEHIVEMLRDDLNNEVSQATNLPPNTLWVKEKEYLLPLPRKEILNTYLSTPLERKVSKESMIMYKNRKYSLPVKYIGKRVEIKEVDGKLLIFDGNTLITSFEISKKKLNYKIEHMYEILGSDVMKLKDKSEIESFARKQLELYDKLGG